MSDPMDLAIRGGTLVSAGAEAIADIGIRGEQIVQIGGEFTAKHDLDAQGMFVLPGGIDPHVHLTRSGPPDDEPQWCDDFASGSRAAVAGGITTIGNMTFPMPGETLIEAIGRDSLLAERDAIIDVMLHPVLTDPDTQPLSDIPLLAERGQTTLKYFMSFGGFCTDPESYLAATQLAADAGMLTMVHCEDAAMIEHATRSLMAQGNEDITHYPESRPMSSEVAATARAVAFAELTGAPTYIVHLSSAGALDEVRRGRQRGAPLFVETRPLYLHLTEERFAEPDGAKYVGQPPLRRQTDVAALWQGLQTGDIDTIGTDHAPWRYADKVVPGMDLTTIRPGVADLDTMLPMLWSEGVTTGRISRQRFVAATSTNAAKLFGLFPRKGCIAPGADADIVIWDPVRSQAVRAADHQTNADYSPYEGWNVTGWPVTTISRGQVVYHQGVVQGASGRGQVLARGVTAPL